MNWVKNAAITRQPAHSTKLIFLKLRKDSRLIFPNQLYLKKKKRTWKSHHQGDFTLVIMGPVNQSDQSLIQESSDCIFPCLLITSVIDCLIILHCILTMQKN